MNNSCTITHHVKRLDGVAPHVVLVSGKALEQRLAPLHVVHDAVPRVARHVEEEALGEHDLLVAPALLVQHELVEEPARWGRGRKSRRKMGRAIDTGYNKKKQEQYDDVVF